MESNGNKSFGNASNYNNRALIILLECIHDSYFSILWKMVLRYIPNNKNI